MGKKGLREVKEMMQKGALLAKPHPTVERHRNWTGASRYFFISSSLAGRY